MLFKSCFNVHYIFIGLLMAIWGVGLSLAWIFNLGIKGVGYGEILFVFYIAILLNDSKFRKNLAYTIKRLSLFLSISVVLMIIFFIGNMVGMVFFEINVNTLFIFLRQSLYFFLLIPIIASLVTERSIKWYLLSFLFGVLFASYINYYSYFSYNLRCVPGRNVIGYQISVIFPFVLYCTLRECIFYKKIIETFILFSLLFIVFLTWSKGAWLTIIITSFVMICMLVCTKEYIAKHTIKINLIVTTLILVALIFFNFSFISYIVKTEIEVSSLSTISRIYSIKTAIQLSLKYPFGVGATNYLQAANIEGIELSHSLTTPHNAYGHILSWVGIIGFPFFLILYFYPLWLVFSNRKILGEYKFIYIPMLLGIYFSANTGGVYVTQPFVWVLFAMIIGHVISIRKRVYFHV